MIKIIDLFCGAGGLTTGASRVPGVQVIACVNHDDVAISSHKANHPEVMHFVEDVRSLPMILNLKQLVDRERKIDPDVVILVWASLECTNFSKAKGGLPRDADSRTLAECLFKYVELLNPDGLWIENVEEFMAWGPLDENGKPVSRRNGSDYVKWCNRVQNCGYSFDFKILNAANYGAYTSRKRFFAQFNKPGFPIVWPEITHSKEGRLDVFSDLKKWKPVREVLDFSNKGKSIFTRKKPLVENSLKRIYAGLIKHVGNGDESFLKKYFSGRPAGKVISVDGPCGTIKTIDGHALVQTEFITQYNGGGHDQRTLATDRPLTSVSTTGRHALVQPEFIIKYYGNSETQSVNQPSGTVTTKDRMAAVWIDKQYGRSENHQNIDRPAGSILGNDKHALMQTFIVKHYSNGGQHNSVDGPAGSLLTVPKENLVQCESFILNPQYKSKGGSINNPCFTLITRMDKMPPYLVHIETTGEMAVVIFPDDSETMRKIKLFMAEYGICDITMRMLTVDELKAIQGFPTDYILLGNQTQQKKHLGNAVEVNMGKSLIQSQAIAVAQMRQAVGY